VATKEQIVENLVTIAFPGVMRSLVEMNLVRSVNVHDHTADISLDSSAIDTETREWLNARIQEAIANPWKRSLYPGR
jgi:hypothetical protein